MSDIDLNNIIETAFTYARPYHVEVDGIPLVVVNKGDGKTEIQNVEALVQLHRPRPRRIETAHTVRDPKSLAAYMNLYADENHMAFVDADKSRVAVTLDYHDAAPDAGNAPRWGDHAVTMQARFAPAYAAWRERHRVAKSQRDTMEFFEDRMVDVVAPDAADIMDMVMNFDALTKVTFSSSQRLRDGRVQVSYKEEEADSGKVTVYEKMTIRVPVFEGAEPEPVEVRIRTRVRDGALNFVFVIANVEDVERAAFERLCDVWRTGIRKGLELREVAI